MTQPVLMHRVELFGGDVIHGFSTRHGGVSKGRFASLNLSTKVGDDPALVQENRQLLLESLDLELQDAVALSQVHGSRVVIAGHQDRGRGTLDTAPAPEEADAVISGEPGLALIIVAADCVPLLFWDPVHRAIGAVHAGWRGTVSAVALKTLEAMGHAFGTRVSDVLVGIGPAIGGCCYEVDEPVLHALQRAFPSHFNHVTRPARPGHSMLDLQEANRLQLRDDGVSESHLEVLDLCTSCHRSMFYSERAEGRPSGRFGAILALPH